MPSPSKSRGTSRSPSSSSSPGSRSHSRSRPRSRSPTSRPGESLGNGSPTDTREEGEADESDLAAAGGASASDDREPQDQEAPPPLPEGPPPEGDDDGWQPLWDDTYQAYYFFNSYTGETTWTNPRVPTADLEQTPGGVGVADDAISGVEGEGGDGEVGEGVVADSSNSMLQYNPAIHGDYDPTAPYAQVHDVQDQETEYTSRAAFNRFTGKFQPAGTRKVPENYNDENKSKRQMEFFFDVDAAASSHDGRSLKAERQTRKLTRKEVKQFQEKRKARKEEKRKAWLRD